MMLSGNARSDKADDFQPSKMPETFGFPPDDIWVRAPRRWADPEELSALKSPTSTDLTRVTGPIGAMSPRRRRFGNAVPAAVNEKACRTRIRSPRVWTKRP